MAGLQLLNKNKRQIANFLKTELLRLPNTPQQLIEILDHLLSPREPIESVEITWLKHLVAGGATFEEFGNTVKQYDNAVVCGLVWTADFVAYRCRTCSVSPCMSLCSDCFQASEHSGHDYNMFRSQAGGACDCGDASVMKQTGFCTRHGPENAKKQVTPPADLLAVAEVMLPRLLVRVLQHMRHHGAPAMSSAYKSSMEDAERYLEFLHNLSDMGAAMRKVITTVLTSEQAYAQFQKGQGDLHSLCQLNYRSAMDSLNAPPTPATFADIVELQASLEHTSLLDEMLFWMLKYEFPQKLVTLLLSILPDDNYKEAFTASFIKHYSRIAVTLIRSDERQQISNRVVHISVQLLSPEGLARKMVDDYHLLYIMLSSLWYMLSDIKQPSNADDDFHSTVDCAKTVLKEHSYWPIISDLINVLSHKPIAHELISNRRLLTFWFELMSCFQGMNVNQRELIQHVEYEPESYYAAFSAELEICASPLWSLVLHCKDKDTARYSEAVIKTVLHELETYFDAINFEPYSRANRLQVSFHLPLHRWLAVFLSNAVRNQGVTLKSVLPSLEFLQMLMVHPLHLQVVFQEVFCGMWVRNGLQIKGQAMTYIQCHFCNSMIDPDLYLLQVCASQLDPDYFVRTLLDRFHVLDLMTFAPIDDKRRLAFFDPDHHMSMTEGALITLCQVITLRNNVGISEEALMRKELVALLCMSDRTHSQLMDLMPEKCSIGQHKDYEAILANIAQYKAPNFEAGGTMQQGMYMPKDYIWEQEFDPLYVMLRAIHRKDFQSAMDRYTQYVKQKGQYKGTETPWPPFLTPTIPLLEDYTNIRKLLHCRTLHGLIFTILYKAVHEKNVTDAVLYLTLYLLELVVASAPPVSVEDKSVQVGSRFDKQFAKWFEKSSIWSNLRMVIPEVMITQYGPAPAAEADRRGNSLPGLAPRGFQVAPSALSSSFMTSVPAALSPGQPSSSGAVVITEGPSADIISTVQAMLNQAASEAVQAQLSPANQGSSVATLAVQDFSHGVGEDELTSSSASFYETSMGSGRTRNQGVSAKMDCIKRIEPLPIDETMLSLLCKLHDKFTGQLHSFLPPASCSDATTGSTAESMRSTVGSGELTVGKLLMRIGKQDSACLQTLRDIHSKGLPADQLPSPAKAQKKEKISLDERRKKARERQQKLMEEFASKQREFMERAGDVTDAEQMDNNEVTLSVEDRYDCVICNQTTPSTQGRPIGLVTLLQSTSVLGHRRHTQDAMQLPTSPSVQLLPVTNCGSEYDERLSMLLQQFEEASCLLSLNIGWKGGVSGQTCGHYVHLDCHRAYVDSLKTQQQYTLDAEKGEYWCPLCRQLSNTALPISPGVGPALSRMPPSTTRQLVERVSTMLHYTPSVSNATSLDRAMAEVMKHIHNATYHSYRTTDESQNPETCSHLFVCSVLRCNLELELLQRQANPLLQPTSSLVSKKSCLFPLLQVLSLSSRLVTAQPLVDLWSQLTGVFPDSTDTSKSLSVHHKEVPILLKDASTLLLHLVMSVPPSVEKETYQFVVRTLYNMVFVQSLALMSCKFADEERMAWRSKCRQSPGLSLAGWMNLIIQFLSYSSLYEDDLDSDPHVPAICQSVWSPQSVEASVQEYCLPFLRICLLLQQHLYGQGAAPVTNCMEPQQEFAELAQCLGLAPSPPQRSPEGATCSAVDPALSTVDCLHWHCDVPEKLVQSWCQHFGQCVNKQPSAARMLLMANPSWFPPRLLMLPWQYEKIFQSYRKRTCPMCSRKPDDPALCLVCGRVLCFKEACCRCNNVCECVQHSIECGAGTGIYLIINSSLIVVIRGPRATMWGSVYLDEHGEEDKDLRRGRPLYLSTERYSLLHQQWLTHSFDHACKRWIFHQGKL